MIFEVYVTGGPGKNATFAIEATSKEEAVRFAKNRVAKWKRKRGDPPWKFAVLQLMFQPTEEEKP
jgi:hypothetical protein